MSQMGVFSPNGGTMPVLTLTGDSGGPVSPDASGNINLFGGDGIITAGAGDTITITADNAGFQWSVITMGQTGDDSHGYFTNDAGPVSVTLPVASSVGDTFQVCAMSAGGWVIEQNAGQEVRLGNQTTTTGAGGSISSNDQGDWITLVCNVANTNWIARAEQGNFNVV